VPQILRAANAGPVAAPVRVLLLARIRDGLPPEVNTSEELAPPYQTRAGRVEAVRDAAEDYTAALTAASRGS
jgi:hypothetical protein